MRLNCWRAKLKLSRECFLTQKIG
uniref:Uncharacterized protein n=1 Tax=Rhizophora mucronata TaxID=61149 RepID=A0A2P2KHA1_RHIMU